MSEDRSQISLVRKVAWAGWVGSALEFYDFFLFNTAAVLFFGPLFFPSAQAGATELAMLSSVAAGFLGRPFGAVLLGHMGDVYGRRLVFCLTLVLMGVSSFLIGLLPTFEQIGMAAPALLVALRLLQGLAISGQHASASALALEISGEGRRGLYASFSLSGTQIGFILSCAVFLVLPVFLTENELRGWGWRIPFLLSLLLAVMGIWARLRLPESGAFLAENARAEKCSHPMRMLWSHYRGRVLRVVLAAQISVVSTIASVFSLSWAVNYTRLGRETMLAILIATALVGMLVIPAWGLLSDRIGRRKVFLVGALGSAIFIWPYFWALSESNVPLSFLFAMLLCGVVYSAANGVWPSLYGEMFGTQVRVSGMAIGTQFGFMLAAQSSPLGAFLIRSAPADWTPVALLVSVSCGISALAVLSAPETYRSALARLGNG